MLGCYLMGQPGAGKSTLMGALTRGVPVEWASKPFAHAVYLGPDGMVAATQLGGDHPDYPGTDRLSMSVQDAAIWWLKGAPAPIVVGEGDRLATPGFLTAFNAEYDLTVVHLATPDWCAGQRRNARGSRQNEAWLRGRITKVKNLAAKLPDLGVRVVTLDGSLPLNELCGQAVDQAPALRELAGLRPAFGG